jgi:putative membrane protein
MEKYYLLIKAFHIISFTAWMAGMFYLPRLFAYHAASAVGSAESEQFKIMERRLLRAIINPAMILTFIFGGLLLSIIDMGRPLHWFDAKFALLILMTALHGFFAVTRKKLARDERPRSARFYKIINELVTIIFIAIVLLAVTKPF